MKHSELSPIMTYGGDTNITGGCFCPTGYEVNMVAVILVVIALLYVLGVFDKFITEGFYMNINDLEKREKATFLNVKDGYYGGGNIYDEQFLTYPREQSVYSGKHGYGRNY